MNMSRDAKPTANLCSIRAEMREGGNYPLSSFVKAHYLLLKYCLCGTQGQEHTDPFFLWLAALRLTVNVNARVLVNRLVEARIGKDRKISFRETVNVPGS